MSLSLRDNRKEPRLVHQLFVGSADLPPHWHADLAVCPRGHREPPPGSDAQITLDLIRDIAVDRKQARLMKLRLSNVQSRLLAVVVTECQFQQFPAPRSRSEQEDYRKPSQFQAKRRCRIPFQARIRTEQFPHFGRGEKIYGFSR